MSGLSPALALYDIGHRCDQGMVRSGNEDRVGVFPLGATPVWGLGAVVADGVGGNAGGERASRRVVETLADRLQDWQVQPERLGDHFGPAARKHLLELTDSIHRRIQQEGGSDTSLEGMGTTMTFLGLTGAHTWFLMHVGDSRAYLLRQGQLRQLTTDQEDPGSGALYQAVGGTAELEPEFQIGRAQAGDHFLICSDGLNKHLDDAAIQSVVRGARTAQEAADQLVDQANRRGGKDNVTVVVIAPKRGRWRSGTPVPRGLGSRQKRAAAVMVALLLLSVGVATTSYLAYAGALAPTTGRGRTVGTIPETRALALGKDVAPDSSQRHEGNDSDSPSPKKSTLSSGSEPRRGPPPKRPDAVPDSSRPGSAVATLESKETKPSVSTSEKAAASSRLSVTGPSRVVPGPGTGRPAVTRNCPSINSDLTTKKNASAALKSHKADLEDVILGKRGPYPTLSRLRVLRDSVRTLGDRIAQIADAVKSLKEEKETAGCR